MGVKPPEIRLGRVRQGGVSPAVMAIVERGVRRRPEQASELKAEIELRMDGYPPVRVLFDDHVVLVEDAPGVSPDLRVSGTLADLVHLMVAPLVGGVPNPINRRGRAAIGMFALGRVRVEGGLALMRRLLSLIQI